MNSGWICLWRDLIDKPIWTCSTNEQKVILITLLCMVNHEPNEWEWQGKKYTVQAGQMITSLNSIVKKCGKGVTTRNVRTALERFENYGFLTSKSTNKNRLITIVNWRKYQSKEVEIDKQTDKQPTSNRQATDKQLTTNNNDNKYNNDNKAKHSKAIDNLNTKEPETLDKLLAKFEAKLSKKQEDMPLSSEKTGMPLPVADVPSSAASVPSLTKSDMPLSEKGMPLSSDLNDFGERLKSEIDYEECVKDYGERVVDAVVDICLSMVEGNKILLGGVERDTSEVAETLLCLDGKSFGVIVEKLKDAKEKHKPRNPKRYYQAIIYATAESYAMGSDLGEVKRRKRGFLNYDSEHGYDHEAIEDMLFDIAVREAEDDEN